LIRRIRRICGLFSQQRLSYLLAPGLVASAGGLNYNEPSARNP
jgi:hypothetical protein